MKAVNLIPAGDRTSAGLDAGRSDGGVYLVLGLLGGLAVLALLYGLAAHQVSSRRSQVASLTARAQQAQAQESQLAPYTSFAALREQRVQAVSGLVDSRFDWAHALHELGRVLPATATISSFTGTIAPAGGTSSSSSASNSSSTTTSSTTAGAATSTAVTSATPPGSVPTFMLSGCALNQAEVARTLDRLRLIDGAKEVTLQNAAQSALAGGGGGGGGGGGCIGVTFTVELTFEALPTVATSPAGSTATVASTTSTGASK